MNDPDYFEKMVMDNRVFIIETPEKILGYVLFSVCNDINLYANKDLFEYKHHDPNGKILFIEKIVASGINFSMVRKIKKFIKINYPNVEYGVWIRSGKYGGKLVTVSGNHAGYQNKIL